MNPKGSLFIHGQQVDTLGLGGQESFKHCCGPPSIPRPRIWKEEKLLLGNELVAMGRKRRTGRRKRRTMRVAFQGISDGGLFLQEAKAAFDIPRGKLTLSLRTQPADYLSSWMENRGWGSHFNSDVWCRQQQMNVNTVNGKHSFKKHKHVQPSNPVKPWQNNTIWDGGSTAPAKQLIPHRTQDFLETLERLKRFRNRG